MTRAFAQERTSYYKLLIKVLILFIVLTPDFELLSSECLPSAACVERTLDPDLHLREDLISSGPVSSG